MCSFYLPALVMMLRFLKLMTPSHLTRLKWRFPTVVSFVCPMLLILHGTSFPLLAFVVHVFPNFLWFFYCLGCFVDLSELVSLGVPLYLPGTWGFVAHLGSRYLKNANRVLFSERIYMIHSHLARRSAWTVN